MRIRHVSLILTFSLSIFAEAAVTVADKVSVGARGKAYYVIAMHCARSKSLFSLCMETG